MRRLVEDVCNINSYTFETAGVDSVREIFKNEYSQFGDSIAEFEMPDFEIVNDSGEIESVAISKAIQIQKRISAGKKVFLCIHLDTVFKPTSGFQKCVESSPGILNGPGVVDAKGGAVIMLFALKAIEKFSAASEIGWEVVLNPDEEIGSPSSQKFLKKRGKHFDFGLLFEPALPDGTLVDQRKGSGNFSIIVRGKSVHSGRDFENGRNAIVEASQLAARLHDLNSEFDDVTINLARIDGGGPFNVVPDLAVVRVNVRVAIPEHQAWFESELGKLVAECDSKDGFSCELHGAFFSPPKVLDPGSMQLKSEIEQAASQVGISVSWRNTGGVSDGNKLSSIGLPNIDTLGARGGELHSADEFLILESLVERAKLTAMILMRYSSGEFSIG